MKFSIKMALAITALAFSSQALAKVNSVCTAMKRNGLFAITKYEKPPMPKAPQTKTRDGNS